MTLAADKSIVALSGGVGGAKLVAGLDKILAPNQLTVVVNTGDDFEHFGLPICPDLDTVLYTLADLNDPVRGWGRKDESWACMETLQTFGGEDWFRLGDKDLGLHLTRRQWLQQGESLSQVVGRICDRLGIACSVVPMSDEPVRTYLQTDQGKLSFQDYFVKQRCAPRVERFFYRDSGNARPSEGFSRALQDKNLAGVVIAPSNPFVSIDPILSLPGIGETLANLGVPVVAISPIVGGKAIKGPAAKMFEELGQAASALSVAQHYGNLLSGFVIDEADRETAERFNEGLKVVVCDTVMLTQADREALARTTLALLVELGEGTP